MHYNILNAVAGDKVKDNDYQDARDVKENIVSLEEHRGAHTKAYKEFVLKKLKEAVEIFNSINSSENVFFIFWNFTPVKLFALISFFRFSVTI